MARAKKKSTSAKSRSTESRKPVTKRPSGKFFSPSKALKKRAVPTPKKKIVRKIAKKVVRKIAIPARFLGASEAPSAYELPKPSDAAFRPALDIDRNLPDRYHEDRMALLVRDPWWIFAYWEVTQARSEEVVARMPWGDRDQRVMVLRVYDLTDTAFDRPLSFFDIELRFPAERWYVDVGVPDRSWGAEIGYRLPDGRFWALVRSNVVRTPRFGFSDVLDEEWMVPDEDFWRLVGGYGPEDFGVSSGEFQRRVGEHFLRTVSSDGASQFSLKAVPPARKKETS